MKKGEQKKKNNKKQVRHNFEINHKFNFKDSKLLVNIQIKILCLYGAVVE